MRPNPVLYELPANALLENRENQSPVEPKAPGTCLPYRSIFAVLTLDSVLIYDTYHSRPLSIIRGLHYAGLTDCSWSKDGLNLLVSSTDGYISIISFQEGELGEVYTSQVEAGATSGVTPHVEMTISPSDAPPIPPCEAGCTPTLEAPPTKRAKKTRIAPILVSAIANPLSSATNDKGVRDIEHTSVSNGAKRSIQAETESVGAAVTKLSLDSDAGKVKKKKRIAPTLVSSN